MAMNQRTMRPTAAGVHPEALAWRTAAVANGGTVSASTLNAVSKFCKAIDAAGIRSSFLRLNLVCGGNLAAARTPLYRGASRTGTQYGATIDTNIGPYTSGDYTQATGLTGDGSTKFLDTTVTIGTLANFGAEYDNVHVSVYNRTSTIGPQFGGTDPSGLWQSNGCALDCSGQANPTFGDTTAYFITGSSTTGDHDVFSSSYGYGFTLALFSSAGTGVIARQGSDLSVTVRNVSSSAFNGLDETSLLFAGMVSTEDGEPVYYVADGALSAYSVGTASALSTPAARTAFYNAMQTFQTAMGRQI